MPALPHGVLKRFTRYVVIYHNEFIRHLIHSVNMRKMRAIAFGKRGPHHAVRPIERNALTHKRPGAVERHELRHTVDSMRQLALDHVGIVDIHPMQNALAVLAHAESSSGFTSVCSPRR